jgi:hypothetical protein
MSYGRNIIVPESNLIGLGPETLKEGDKICVLLGCSMPVILRKVENHYIYIGEAFIDGYMFGKAIEELEQGKHELEDFELW